MPGYDQPRAELAKIVLSGLGLHEEAVVRVTPGPVLAGLERHDDGMIGRLPVPARVATGRVLAAPHVSASQALAKVYPLRALAKAALAALESGRRDGLEVEDMGALLVECSSGVGVDNSPGHQHAEAYGESAIAADLPVPDDADAPILIETEERVTIFTVLATPMLIVALGASWLW
ncbi:unannotated protein [freshwater metagenome]|uniref:Unannotated protein n=1 Tax=freshwater metagenome TaxID=449393 RepID=A0A6J7KJ57_9ZZZZ